MEIHLPTAVTMRTSSRSSTIDRRPHSSRSGSYNSMASSHSRSPVHIPGARTDEAPPPLPPPRYNEELDRGVDVAWSWQNSPQFGVKSKLAPIKPSSSLHGGYMQRRGNTRHVTDGDEMDLDDVEDDDDRRGSTVSTIRSSSQTETTAGNKLPSFVRRPPSPTPSNQRLQGEQPLARENIHRSSHAYDQSLLSKIGKPNSPNSPPHRRSDSIDQADYSRKPLSLQTRDPKNHHLMVADLPKPSLENGWRGLNSPISSSVSPGSKHGWRDYNMDYRSSNETTSTPLVLDPELFIQSRGSNRTFAGNDDSASEATRSHRGSYDQVMFNDVETESQSEDTGNGYPLEPRVSHQGMKRRALSPPSEGCRDERPLVHSGDLTQKAGASPSMGRSPLSSHRPQPAYGSVSSTSSSLRQQSHPSSFAPSIAGSSLTSISSFERQSPSETFITSANLYSSPIGSIPPAPHKQPFQQSPEDKSVGQGMTIQTPVTASRAAPTTRLGSFYICDCCPKKPKKFDKEGDLRTHQMEKQYICQYCNNRFKNKNEAERHQNSLHLRRISWSCAAIPSYQSVFHPNASTSSPEPNPSTTDTCGFCGEEFSNYPAPDWDRRIDHLSNVHKFGECNHSKKFYRADHFRQHLKHSHGGQSGKWTNILESVCLREEAPSEAMVSSPTASDAGQGRSLTSLPGSADTPRGAATMTEPRKES